MEEIKLNINTGIIKVIIGDEDTQLGSFRFNPSDIDIVKRYDKVVGDIEALKITNETTYEEVLDISEQLKKCMDYLLNYDVSEDIFKVCNPLTPTTDGDFYFEHVLEGVGNVIESVTKERLERKHQKIKKALEKYN